MSAINSILFWRNVVNICYILLIVVAAFCTTYASTLEDDEKFAKFVFRWNAFAFVFATIPGFVVLFGMGINGIVLPVLCYVGVVFIMKSTVSLMGGA